MKATCKTSYPYERHSSYLSNLQLFIINEIYEYKIIYHPDISGKTSKWYLVNPHDEYSKPELFDEIDFEMHFISSNDVRKKKLENIYNEQDLQRLRGE